MAIRRPEPDDLARIAQDFHFTIGDERMPTVQALLEAFLGPYDRLEEIDEPSRSPRHSRDSGAAPRSEENPLGAWAWRAHITGAATGPLAGKTIAVKDNIAVADLPMVNGTAVLEGYVPDEDATGRAGAGRRRHDPRQGCLREPLLLRRQPYL
jgi:amidase